MANYDNEERFLEDLLTKMPKMIDQRSPEEIYRKINSNSNERKRKKLTFLIPSLVAVCVTILIILISSTPFMDKDKEMASTNRSEDRAAKKVEADIHQSEQKNKLFAVEKKNASSTKEELNDVNAVSRDITNRSAVYKENLKENDVFTYGVFTKDAVVVPISVLVPKSNTNWFTRYINTLKSIPLKNWGFDSDPIFKGDLDYDRENKMLRVIINKKDWSKVPEYVELNLDHILQYSFSFTNNVTEIHFSDENGQDVELNNIGVLKNIHIENLSKTGYFIYTLSNGKKLLIPSDEKFSSFKDAFENMKKAPNDFYHPIIPKETTATIKEDKSKRAIIQFKENLNLTKLVDTDFQYIIEGVLLAAKSFGYESVAFKNISPLDWEGFDFSKPINVPVSPNQFIFEKK